MKRTHEKANLAIFDLDGTLFDTGDVNYYSYKDALQPYKLELDREYFIEQCNGRHYTEFLPMIMGSNIYLEAVHNAKKEAYVNNLDKARINAHLFQLIPTMRSNYYTAIVTTASRKNAEDILNFFHYIDYFDSIITQEDTLNVKPDPEGFLRAMTIFHMDARHTIIFEDSDVGIRAARATGAAVMIVNHF